MKKTHAIAAAAAVVLGASAGLSAPSSAAPSARAEILGPVRIDGDVATVTAHYVCEASEHLWVSAKQVGDRRPDRRLQQPGSSGVVAATGGGWWQSHPANFTCDGEWHTDTFTIGTFEFGIGELAPGQAWFQFCLTAGEEILEVNESGWVAVR